MGGTFTKVDNTTVSYDIAKGPLQISDANLPKQATTLVLVNSRPKEVTKMPQIWATHGSPNTTLRTVRIDESCRSVTEVGDNFLSWCTALPSLDLSPLSNVSSVGMYFLYSCKSLSSLDLSPLSKVHHGMYVSFLFLHQCTALEEVLVLAEGSLWLVDEIPGREKLRYPVKQLEPKITVVSDTLV